MSQRACDECSESYEAKSDRSRYCGRACIQRARRKADRQSSKVLEQSSKVLDEPRVSTDEDLALITSTMAALVAAGQVETVLGQIALTLARDLALARYGAGAHASLAKELRTVMAEIAPAKADAATSPAEEIRGRGASRRTGPTVLRIVS